MNDATPAPRATEPVAAAAPPGLSELFIAYALISLYGFGGVLAGSGRAARPADAADHRHRRVVCPLRRSAGAAARTDRRYGGGGRPDHVDGCEDGACAVSLPRLGGA